MKKFLPVLFLIFLCPTINAQLLKRLGDRAKQKMEQKAGEKVDKSIDDATDGKSKTKTDEGEVKEKTDGNETKVKTESKGEGIKSFSKYDFVPGEKIVYAEDFAQDAIGEFPLKWNTNGTGEVVTIEGQPGKWLKMTSDTKYQTPFSNKLPENYTVEFDLLLNFKASMRVPDMEFVVFNNTSKTTYPPGFRLFIAPQSGNYNSGTEQNSIDRFRIVSYDNKGERFLESKDQLNGELYNNKSKPVHVALWVQKERVRVWINQVKIYDLPKALPSDVALNSFMMETGSYGSSSENYDYYLSNLKVAVALPDTRSKLITEGKWSTTGILFDVNSDKIKPISYGVLKEIATTLKENPDVKVKIIGHTDSDGDEAKNLDLSKRRAASVRIVLTTEFGIDGSRFETDGLGETKPVSDNNTPEGKANNRRVEFVKV
jgi:outer membrane protein OmpA-like peptidoglycan-associated protein